MLIKPTHSTVLSDPEHRYALVAQKLQKGTSVLDVGGYNDRRKLIARVIGDDFQYTAINTSGAWYDDKTKYTKYDGLRLPFENQQFEVAISVDTLEHIDHKDRQLFVTEMTRVGQKVVLVAPFSDPSRSTLEPSFARISKVLGVEVKPSIEEHIKKGLPTLNDIEAYFVGQNFAIEFGTDYTKFWQMIFLQLVVNVIGRKRSKKTNELVQKIFEARLQQANSLDKSKAYRVIVST